MNTDVHERLAKHLSNLGMGLPHRDKLAVVDNQWCIGCGVCVNRCDDDAIQIVKREDSDEIPVDFESRHQRILHSKEKSL